MSECKGECQYALDVDMTEYSCYGDCYYKQSWLDWSKHKWVSLVSLISSLLH